MNGGAGDAAPSRTTIGRRRLLSLASAGSAAALFPRAGRAATDADVLADRADRLAALGREWESLTTSCNIGEVKRELLGQDQKASLIEEAGQLALFNKDATMVIKCRRTPLPASEVLKGADRTVVRALERLIPEADDPDALITLREAYEQHETEAEAAAYLSRSGDFGVNNPFLKGSRPASEDIFLERARVKAVETEQTLRSALSLIRQQNPIT